MLGTCQGLCICYETLPICWLVFLSLSPCCTTWQLDCKQQFAIHVDGSDLYVVINYCFVIHRPRLSKTSTLIFTCNNKQTVCNMQPCRHTVPKFLLKITHEQVSKCSMTLATIQILFSTFFRFIKPASFDDASSVAMNQVIERICTRGI